MKRFILLYIMLVFFIFAVDLSFAENPPKRVTFALVGDIMPGSDFPDSSKILPADEGRYLFRYVKKMLSSADVAIGNLEGTITRSNNVIKVIQDSTIVVQDSTFVVQDSTTYVFRIPPFLGSRLAEAGFDVLSTANNHANDFGLDGQLETESILDSLGIAYTGRKGCIAELSVNGLQIAVVGFSPNPGKYSLIDIDAATALVESLDSRFDIVVVTFHGGAEGEEFTHTPTGQEHFLGEKRGDLRLFVHRVVDAGADVVFGHGPHVPRGMELYRNKIIAYSLGNFCTWYGINVRGVNGLAPLLWIEVDSEGNLQHMKIVSFEQQSFHYPVPDPDKRAEKLIIELSKTDFGSFPGEMLLKEDE
ncbi:MAG: CapA family protein [Candidatus Latescibacteria bacterium]|jgi:hypothetical protein|nr:CapA family protein [Candidatus Latescibacterota bacterium]